MAERKDPFSKITKSERPQATPVTVTTSIRKKTGRPRSFDVSTDRLTVDIPVETLVALKRYLPGSSYKSLAQVVDTALNQFLQENIKK